MENYSNYVYTLIKSEFPDSYTDRMKPHYLYGKQINTIIDVEFC